MQAKAAAGVANSVLRARSADYLDFNLSARRKASRRSQSLHDHGSRTPRAGKPSADEDELKLFRSLPSSPRHEAGVQHSSASDFWTKAESPRRGGRAQSPLSATMSGGDAVRQALQSPDARLVHSTSLPARCFLPSQEEPPSSPKTANNGSWLKCEPIPEALVRVAVTRSSLGKRKERANAKAQPQINSVLTGHGERTVIRPGRPRVNGEGLANSLANKASFGIAWRRLPVYSSQGVLQTTMVDPDISSLPMRISPTIMSAGMKDLLEPSANKEAEEADPFEKWLLTVGECIRKAALPTPQRCSSPSPPPPGPNLHQTFKPHRKIIRPVVASTADEPKRAPRSPSLSPRAVRAVSPVAADIPPNPPSRKDYFELRAGGKEYFDLKAAETVPENKRTWQFQQDMARIRVQRSTNTRLSLGRRVEPAVVHVHPMSGFKQDLDFTGSRDTLSTQVPSDDSLRTPPLAVFTESKPRWR